LGEGRKRAFDAENSDAELPLNEWGWLRSALRTDLKQQRDDYADAI
jgi:hypothetical protein